MNILFINGSPNRSGNTVRLTKKFLKDQEFKTLNLVDYKIYSYGQNFEDDQLDEVIEQMKQADDSAVVPGGTPAFGSGSSRRSFIQGKQRAAGCTGSGRIGDPVREWGDAGISGGAIEGEDRSAEPEFSLRCPA